MKSLWVQSKMVPYQSLPTRECGLKFSKTIEDVDMGKSLPTRECGLKFLMSLFGQRNPHVTPYAGVWIEIK